MKSTMVGAVVKKDAKSGWLTYASMTVAQFAAAKKEAK